MRSYTSKWLSGNLHEVDCAAIYVQQQIADYGALWIVKVIYPKSVGTVYSELTSNLLNNEFTTVTMYVRTYVQYLYQYL